MQSVFQALNDDYEINLIICYDDLRAKEYIVGPAFYVGGKYEGDFHYNLYCNDLLDQVKEPGHILFLDDDDELINVPQIMDRIEAGKSYIVPFVKGDIQKPLPAQMYGRVLKQGYCGMPNMLLWSGHRQHVKFEASEHADYKAIAALLQQEKVSWLNIPMVKVSKRGRGYTE